jgi:hypothetical protein
MSLYDNPTIEKWTGIEVAPSLVQVVLGLQRRQLPVLSECLHSITKTKRGDTR